MARTSYEARTASGVTLLTFGTLDLALNWIDDNASAVAHGERHAFPGATVYEVVTTVEVRPLVGRRAAPRPVRVFA